MSGLEVAGIVLGSLPLVISALEHYADGLNTAKRFWRYKSEVRSLILQVSTERGIFINTLEQLLTGIVRIEHMSAFLTSPGGDEWKEAAVESKLKDRLRGTYEIYLENVKGMGASLQQMKQKLALDPDGKPQFSDPSLFKQEFKRLRFCISKTEYAEQLGEIRSYNQALTHLTKQSLELEPARRDGKSSASPTFSLVQEYARALFDTLCSGLRCGCDGHAVKLRLESRRQLQETKDDLHMPFRVIFTNDAATGVHSPLTATGCWSWKEADVRCMAGQPKQTAPPVCAANACSAPALKKRVRFGPVQIQPNVQDSMTSIFQQQTTLITAPVSDQIQDLCKAIAQMQQPTQDLCIGYLMDTVQRKHGIYLLNSSSSHAQQPWSAYTLREVLTRRANINRRLTKHDKLRLAVDLASSVLQLYKTPWLSEQWTDNDVYFVLRPDTPMVNVYEHPFVYRKLTSVATSGPAAHKQTASRVIRNPTLFTLGILLIELLYGKPIEELELPSDLDCQGTPGSTWCTAVRLIDEEIEFEAGPRYLDAVRRCIRCDFNRKEADLDDETFQQAVFEGVVAPLERTLQQFRSLD